jgi:membrane protein YdbS with pleckstrin-like domain
MAMRLFFVLVTVVGSAYLLFTERGDRKVAIAAVAVSAFGLLLQLNVVSLHMRYARTVVWAIAVCAGLLWMRDNSKTASTVAAGMAFVSALTVALSLRLLH